MSDLSDRISHLSPRQRSAVLARLAEGRQVRPVPVVDPVDLTGPVPLLPVQRLLLDQLQAYGADPNKYDVAALVQAPCPLRPELAEAALAHLIAHHDALRLRFARTGGGWGQEVVNPPGYVPFHLVDLPDLPADGWAAAMVRTARELQDDLDLGAGPVLRMALFRFAQDEPSRLLLVVHHLVADAYSIEVLWGDFWAAYQQLEHGEAVRLPATASFKAWAERLHAYAESPAFEQDVQYWHDPAWDRIEALPTAQGTSSHGAALTSMWVSMSPDETGALLGAVPAGTQLPEVLLASLVMSLRRWTGSETFALHLVQHGRAPLLDGIDLSHTVGWLTVHPPVLIELAGSTELVPAARAVAEQLSRVPLAGIPWEWMRYRTPPGKGPEWPARLQQTRVIFDYLGGGYARPSGLRPVPENVDGAFGAPHVWGGRTLMIAAQVINGHLRLKFAHDQRVYPPDAIKPVAEGVRATLRTLARPELARPAEEAS